MAGTIDVSLTGYFSVMFTFLFAFVLVYALLEYVKPFSDKANKGWHAMIALCISILTVVYKPAVGIISFLAPWFLIMAIVIFFILFTLGIFGLKEKDFLSAVKHDTTIYTFIIVFAIVFVVIALGTVFGQQFLSKGGSSTTSTTTGSDSASAGDGSITNESVSAGNTYRENVYDAIFHPKVLGFVFLMLVGVFTIVFMTKSQMG
ncbi:MAG: hypothetical protein V1725_02970 [archaeon]